MKGPWFGRFGGIGVYRWNGLFEWTGHALTELGGMTRGFMRHVAQPSGWSMERGSSSEPGLGSESTHGFDSQSSSLVVLGFGSKSDEMEAWALSFWAWPWALRMDLRTMCFHFGHVRIAGRIKWDSGLVPKITLCSFFYTLSRFLGPTSFSGKMASCCICEGKGVDACETASFVLVDETMSFP